MLGIRYSRARGTPIPESRTEWDGLSTMGRLARSAPANLVRHDPVKGRDSYAGMSSSRVYTGSPRACARRTSSSAPLEAPANLNTASQRSMSRCAIG
jgi:hypothetical protein